MVHIRVEWFKKIETARDKFSMLNNVGDTTVVTQTRTAPFGAVWCSVSLDITANMFADPILLVLTELSKILFRVNINMPACHCGNRNSQKAVYTEHTQINTHFDGLTTIGSGLRNA